VSKQHTLAVTTCGAHYTHGKYLKKSRGIHIPWWWWWWWCYFTEECSVTHWYKI